MAMRSGRSLSDVLRKAIAESGMAHIALERATGVQRHSIIRFVRGSQSLRLDMADRLAVYFGLELRPKRKGR
jgi:plasmid maintenance system antidote protein VapI